MVVLLCLLARGVSTAQSTAPSPSPQEKQQALWQKLENSIGEVDRNLDGAMGVAILDLTDGHKYLLHANDVFAQASSIKICVLAELYRQAQQGKLKLTDLYTVNAADLVQDSDIMGGLTPGVTKITLRDLATMMVAVSDNSATNSIRYSRRSRNSTHSACNSRLCVANKIRGRYFSIVTAAPSNALSSLHSTSIFITFGGSTSPRSTSESSLTTRTTTSPPSDK